ncbi:MAG TPA: hypothetical protein VFZ09_12805 [Archangium sp.]|uniref:hypothetical protein n=1 Tax=Archangium sp. TaxID=1872627 RepID=UPI002E3704A1|nr:hypothetical protein [Archangium sp.]HEX5747115.1 hypothetical protein [Archangium sp.]
MSPLSRMMLVPLLLFLGVADSAASSGGQLPRIGWVYRLEGHLNGQTVIYVGSAADLKQRLTNNHKWARLLQQEGTKVYAKEVFANLDVPSSNRQTLLSARTEALRAAEQRVLEQAREQIERANRRLATSEKETRLLNELNASTDATAWAARHKVTTSDRWQLVERRVAGTAPKALMALTLLDAWLLYRDARMSQYVMAPYVLGDERGFFTLEQSTSLLPSRHYKAYLSGSEEGQKIEISASEFRSLRDEAEALWGTTDWKGDFVPGLLNRELPVIQQPDAVPME